MAASNPKRRIIAIDGPAGTGKSSIATRLAAQLGWRALDTGATYRALTLVVIREGIDTDNDTAIAKLAEGMSLAFEETPIGTRLRMDGQDITRAIREEVVSRTVARVSRHPRVRHELVQLQRKLAAAEPAVAEGRDMGTAVFPDAGLKFFLTATVASRVQRRMLQLESMNQHDDAGTVEKFVIERDRMDRVRPVGALRAAADARIVDTTVFSEDAVLDILVAQSRAAFGTGAA